MYGPEDNNRVTIVHGLPDTNSGGAALAIALVGQIRGAFPNGCDLGYVSYHRDQSLCRKAHRWLERACPDVKILPSPVTGAIDLQSQGTIRRKAMKLLWLAGTPLWLLYLAFPGLIARRPACRAIRQSRMVLSRGTHIFFETRGSSLKQFLDLAWICFPLLYAWRCGTPFCIYAQSFGPIHGRGTKRLLRFTFQKAFLVLPREELSWHFAVENLAVAKQNLLKVPDSVFSINLPEAARSREILAAHGLEGGRYLAVTVRDFGTDSGASLALVRDAIDLAFDQGTISRCVIVEQTAYFNEYRIWETDTPASRSLFEGLRHQDRCQVIAGPLPPQELLAIYSGADCLFGMRLHSVIFALSVGTPAIALSLFGPKYAGILGELGLDDYVVKLDSADPEQVAARIACLLGTLEQQRERVRQATDRTRAQAQRSLPLILEVLADRETNNQSLANNFHVSSGRSRPF